MVDAGRIIGNTQIYVHPDAASYANDVLGATVLGATRSSDGKPLTFYNDIVDAHEFGHAYANVILRTKIGETYPWALKLENAVRERRNMPNHRVRE